ncbi:hypothetical protein AKG11_11495 [Shinella sp. SUS2]|nr:hypothetical protein AKG11_11495 [Shinella sp. SUS2]KOC73861.1 hypothetical protein AKG10_19945 [Shinella sp. GWS1]
MDLSMQPLKRPVRYIAYEAFPYEDFEFPAGSYKGHYFPGAKKYFVDFERTVDGSPVFKGPSIDVTKEVADGHLKAF